MKIHSTGSRAPATPAHAPSTELVHTEVETPPKLEKAAQAPAPPSPLQERCWAYGVGQQFDKSFLAAGKITKVEKREAAWSRATAAVKRDFSKGGLAFGGALLGGMGGTASTVIGLVTFFSEPFSMVTAAFGFGPAALAGGLAASTLGGSKALRGRAKRNKKKRNGTTDQAQKLAEATLKDQASPILVAEMGRRAKIWLAAAPQNLPQETRLTLESFVSNAAALPMADREGAQQVATLLDMAFLQTADATGHPAELNRFLAAFEALPPEDKEHLAPVLFHRIFKKGKPKGKLPAESVEQLFAALATPAGQSTGTAATTWESRAALALVDKKLSNLSPAQWTAQDADELFAALAKLQAKEETAAYAKVRKALFKGPASQGLRPSLYPRFYDALFVPSAKELTTLTAHYRSKAGGLGSGDLDHLLQRAEQLDEAERAKAAAQLTSLKHKEGPQLDHPLVDRLINALTEAAFD